MEENRAVRLDFPFDAKKLREDTQNINSDEWLLHVNERLYHGDWSALPLLAPEGTLDLHPIAQIVSTAFDPREYVPTPLLENSPNIQEVLSRFHTTMKTTRLMRLKPGSKVDIHDDPDFGFNSGEVRIHLVIQTNPDVLFTLGGEEIHMKEGETWLYNFSLPHGVENKGETDRIHLVIDCEVNDWLKELIKHGVSVDG